jgi:peptidoglycan/xylan/chitin deacetylase (PgdA/CDA1 family)
MALDELIRGPSRPTRAQLDHRRRQAGALIAVAAIALVLGAIAGAGGGAAGSGATARGAARVGWYGHLQALAGSGRQSLAVGERAQENAAIDRALAKTPFVRLAGTQHKLVALTFDDGPGPYTSAVIDTLQRLAVPGTFFIVGRELTDFGAATVQRQASLGLPLGDHTQDHANLSQLAPAGQRAEIARASRAMMTYGAPRPRLFRPPYGAYDQATFTLLRRMRMLTVLWSVDSEDYLKPGVARIVQNVVGSVTPGAIVLMHDAGGDRSETIAALPLIVRALRRRGYGFTTVPRLLLENPPPANQQLPPGFNSGGAG